MRLFLIFANHGAEGAAVIRLLQKQSHQVIYWVGAENPEVKNFPEIIFHKYSDAHRGIPAAGINASKYPTPPADLIRKLYRVESMGLLILNKLFPRLPFEERRHMYFEILRYWYGVFNEFRPDAVIFPLSPASTYSYILCELAKHLGIKTIMFSDTWVSDRTLVHTDLWDPGIKLRQALANNAGKNFKPDDLAPDLRSYYLKQTGQNMEAARPWYMKLHKDGSSGLKLIRRKIKIFAGSFANGRFLGLLYNFFASRLGPNLWKEYRRRQVTPDLSKKFVFVPLQYQPERTTTPLAEIYADLILLIETVAAALPEGWRAYVKEHPAQWWKQGRRFSPFRYRGYYEKIARIPNVFLAPTEYDNFKLINHAQAVATATSTAGWEAVLRGRPAVILGYPWYRDCPLMIKAEDAATCRAAFEKIKDGFKIEKQEVVNFLKSFDDAALHCYVDDPYNSLQNSVSELSSEQRLNNLAQAINQELLTHHYNES